MPAETAPPRESISLLGLLASALRHRRLIAWSAATWMVAVSLFVLLAPREYTVRSSFIPQSRRSNSPLTGLAAQLGLLTGADAGQSPAFYAALLGSRELLEAVVRTVYASGDGPRRTLIDIYRAKGGTEPERAERAVRHLRSKVSFAPDAKTGLVMVVVVSNDAMLSSEISARFLELLNEFNLHARQTQAAAERQFTQGRVSEVQAELRGAEDQLQRFLQQNRDYRNSPLLEFTQQRLQQQVALQRALYSTLQQALEQARIEEVRDTPVISVVEPPAPPALPDSRALVVKAILALLIGAAFGLLLALGGELLRGPDGQVPDEVSDLRAAWRDARRDVQHRVRSLRGGAG